MEDTVRYLLSLYLSELQFELISKIKHESLVFAFPHVECDLCGCQEVLVGCWRDSRTRKDTENMECQNLRQLVERFSPVCHVALLEAVDRFPEHLSHVLLFRNSDTCRRRWERWFEVRGERDNMDKAFYPYFLFYECAVFSWPVRLLMLSKNMAQVNSLLTLNFLGLKVICSLPFED